MTSNSAYEQVHPNDERDATTFAEDFLRFLLNGDVKFAMNAFCDDELLDAKGFHMVKSVMEEEIRTFTAKVLTFIEKDIKKIDCVVDGDYATVKIEVSWDGLMAESLERKSFSGFATLRMKRSAYSGWDVIQAIVPGWNA